MSEMFGQLDEVILLSLIMSVTQMIKSGLNWEGFKAVILTGAITYLVAFPYYFLNNLPVTPMMVYLSFIYSTLLWVAAAGGYKLIRSAGRKNNNKEGEEV